MQILRLLLEIFVTIIDSIKNPKNEIKIANKLNQQLAYKIHKRIFEKFGKCKKMYKISYV